MKVSVDSAIHLIHEAGYGALATHSLHLPGFPYATILPFVPDENHNLLFFISRLAEHTKNLMADARASFLVALPDGEDVLAGPRITLAGEARQAEPSTESMARFFRYHPEMRQLAGFGDFAFFRMTPLRLRLIAGFGQAGWLEGAAWQVAAPLSPVRENAMLDELERQAWGGRRVLGLDCYGADVGLGEKRLRLRFPGAPLAPEAILPMVKGLLESGGG